MAPRRRARAAHVESNSTPDEPSPAPNIVVAPAVPVNTAANTHHHHHHNHSHHTQRESSNSGAAPSRSNNLNNSITTTDRRRFNSSAAAPSPSIRVAETSTDSNNNNNAGSHHDEDDAPALLRNARAETRHNNNRENDEDSGDGESNDSRQRENIKNHQKSIEEKQGSAAIISTKETATTAAAEARGGGAAGNNNPSTTRSNTTWCHMNVGGTTMSCMRETLLSAGPDSILAKWATNNFVGCPRDEGGLPFIDRDPRLFRHVLNHLRGYPLMTSSSDGTLLAEEAASLNVASLCDQLGCGYHGAFIFGQDDSRPPTTRQQDVPRFLPGPGVSADGHVLSSSLLVVRNQTALQPVGMHKIVYRLDRCDWVGLGVASRELLDATGGGPKSIDPENPGTNAAAPVPAATLMGKPTSVILLHTGDIVACVDEGGEENDTTNRQLMEGDMIEISVTFFRNTANQNVSHLIGHHALFNSNNNNSTTNAAVAGGDGAAAAGGAAPMTTTVLDISEVWAGGGGDSSQLQPQSEVSPSRQRGRLHGDGAPLQHFGEGDEEEEEEDINNAAQQQQQNNINNINNVNQAGVATEEGDDQQQQEQIPKDCLATDWMLTTPPQASVSFFRIRGEKKADKSTRPAGQQQQQQDDGSSSGGQQQQAGGDGNKVRERVHIFSKLLPPHVVTHDPHLHFVVMSGGTSCVTIDSAMHDAENTVGPEPEKSPVIAVAAAAVGGGGGGAAASAGSNSNATTGLWVQGTVRNANVM